MSYGASVDLDGVQSFLNNFLLVGWGSSIAQQGNIVCMGAEVEVRYGLKEGW